MTVREGFSLSQLSFLASMTFGAMLWIALEHLGGKWLCDEELCGANAVH